MSLLLRARFIYLAALMVFLVVAAIHVARLRIDHANDAMNAHTASERRVSRELKRTFGDRATYILAVAQSDTLSPRGVQLLRSLTTRVAQLPEVAHVDSLTTAVTIVSSPRGPVAVPLVPDTDGGALSEVLAERLDGSPYLTGFLISADRSTAAILIEPTKTGAKRPHRLIASLQRIVSEYEDGPAALHLTGVPLQKHAVVEGIRRDQAVLVPAVVVVLVLALAWSFRHVWGVLLPLFVTVVSLLGTLAGYQLAGLRLNPITSLLAPAVMVLSISTSVHLYHGVLTSKIADRTERILRVTRSLAPPCAVAAATTAFGFGSLAVSPLPAVRYFGVFAAFGVLLSFAVAMTLLPIALWSVPIGSRPAPDDHRLFAGTLEMAARTATNHPLTVLAIATLISILAAGPALHITNNTDLVRFLRQETPLYRDTMFIDRHLMGPNSLDVVVKRRDGRRLDAADFKRLNSFVDTLQTRPEISGVWSVLPLLAELHRADTGEATLRLPDNDDDLEAYLEMLELGDRIDVVRRLINPRHDSVRLRISVHAIGTAQGERLLDAMDGIAQARLGDAYEVAPAGAFYGIIVDSNRLVRVQLESFAIAFVLVFATMGLTFRSWRLGMVAIVPNVLPVLWTAGLMGYTGIALSSGTVMVASVVIGIAVDDTVHYLSRFLQQDMTDERRAIVRTTTEIGAALIVSSIVLAAGFWVGCLGSFRPTVHFSILAGTTMLTALCCDLLVLPACLTLTARSPRLER